MKKASTLGDVHMKAKRFIAAVLVSLVTLSSSGCFTADFDGIDKRLLWELREASVEKKIKFKIGPLTMSMLKAVTTFAPLEPEVKGMVRGISSIDIAVYELSNTEEVSLSGSLSRSIAEQLGRKGWEQIVRAKEIDSMAFVFCRYDDVRIKGIYVIAMEAEELVLVKIHGRLDHVLALAMEMAERPDTILQIGHN
jgi:hypothetical protein